MEFSVERHFQLLRQYNKKLKKGNSKDKYISADVLNEIRDHIAFCEQLDEDHGEDGLITAIKKNLSICELRMREYQPKKQNFFKKIISRKEKKSTNANQVKDAPNNPQQRPQTNSQYKAPTTISIKPESRPVLRPRTIPPNERFISHTGAERLRQWFSLPSPEPKK